MFSLKLVAQGGPEMVLFHIAFPRPLVAGDYALRDIAVTQAALGTKAHRGKLVLRVS